MRAVPGFCDAVVIWGHGRSYVYPDNWLTSNKVAGLRPRLSPYSFVHHKRVCRKRCPTSLPFGSPPLHCTLQRRKKLAFSSNIFLRIPAKFRFFPAASHGRGSFKNTIKPLIHFVNYLKLAPFLSVSNIIHSSQIKYILTSEFLSV